MTNRPARRRHGLAVPKTRWPTAVAFAATPGLDDRDLQEAIQRTHAELEQAMRKADRRREIRWMAVDSDEVDQVLADLRVAPDARQELRAYCRAHPAGRLVAAWCDFEPPRRHYTILGG